MFEGAENCQRDGEETRQEVNLTGRHDLKPNFRQEAFVRLESEASHRLLYCSLIGPLSQSGFSLTAPTAQWTGSDVTAEPAHTEEEEPIRAPQ
ncbi:50S ribosomal protein L25, partial [Dissostichus eleginoides]